MTEPWTDRKAELFQRCKSELEQDGLTKAQVSAATVGRNTGCEVVVAIGCGITMDTARVAALEMTNQLFCFEYPYFQLQPPTSSTLPIEFASTTSGTGSDVSKCSVVTDADKGIKTGIVSGHIFARNAIVDPTLKGTAPPKVTATQLLAEALPLGVGDGHDLQACTRMAIADTLVGTCIANVGTTLLDSLAQPISGHFLGVSHGDAVYLSFIDFSWQRSIAKFARVARILAFKLASATDEEASRRNVETVRTLLSRISCHEALRSVACIEKAFDVLVREAVDFLDIFVISVLPSPERVRQMFAASL